MRHRRLLALILTLWAPLAVRADVKLPAIFSPNMVLQQGMPVPVWGKAAPGESVTVTFLGQKKTTEAGKDGSWAVKLDELKAGGPHELIVAGKNTVKLENVMVGEVWLCSGQSNMEWALSGTENGKEEAANSTNPNLRLSNGGAWQAAAPNTSLSFSGTGYYFGKDLQKALNVPVGLINRSVGGTSARAWTSKATIQSDSSLKPYADDILKGGPGNLYEGLIRPLIPFAIRGVAWYQGESDANRPLEYQKLFPAMIRSWRADWAQGEFPFLFVELGAIGSAPKDPTNIGWGPIREAQAMALALPKTAMASFVDSDSDLHPRKKSIAGARLALAARALAYGEKIVFAGPRFETLKIDGDKAIVQFQSVGSGLMAKGDKLVGFAVAGDDGKFVWADAQIKDNTVIVSSKQVTRPTAVRYAFASNPQATLYNREGLPAVPFRTDAAK